MNENVIKSSDVAPKKQTKASKNANEKLNIEVDQKTDKDEKSTVRKKNIAKASPGKKFVYFSSGSAYITREGFRFSKEKRIYEIDQEEAEYLLSLENFRLPDQLELEDYYKENN